jgi:hypothetical protein
MSSTAPDTCRICFPQVAKEQEASSAMDEGATPSETPEVEFPARADDSLAEEISGGLLGALRPCGIADVAMVQPPPPPIPASQGQLSADL